MLIRLKQMGKNCILSKSSCQFDIVNVKKIVKELKVLWRNGDITWEEEQSLRETVNDDVDEFLNKKKS